MLHRERSGVVSGHHGLLLTRQIVQLRMTGNYQSFFTGQLIAIILFNCCFYFQGTISSSTLLGELGSEPPLPAKLSPTVLSELPHTPPSTSQTYSTDGSSPHAIVSLKVWREDIHCSCPMWSLHLPVSPNMFISFV